MEASPRIERFLRSICSQIRDTQASRDTYNELLDHIECKVEWLMKSGCSKETATSKALEEMGDAPFVAGQLGAIHSHIPSLDLGHALSKIFWGYLLSSFQIDFGYSKLILQTVGFFLLLAGTFQLRACNKMFRRSFQGFCFLFLFHLITNSLLVLPDIPSAALSFMSFLTGTLHCVCVFVLFLGLSRLRDCLEDGGPYGVSRCAGLYLAMNLLVFLALWIPVLSYLVFIFFLGCLLYIMRQIYSLRKALLLQDVRLRIQIFHTRSRVVLGSVLAFFFIVPILCGYAAATPKPFQTSYSLPEQGLSEQTADIRDRLLASDIPEDRVRLLPEQELERLTGLEEISHYWQERAIDDGWLSLNLAACRLESHQIRFLFWLSWEEIPKHGYRDTFWPIANANPYYNANTLRNPDELLLVLTSKEGHLQSMPPAAVRRSPFGTVESLDVRVLPDADAQYILYAVTLDIDGAGDSISQAYLLDCAYTHRSSFICYPYSNSSSAGSSTTSSYQRQVMSTFFEFLGKPEYSGRQ